MTCPTGPLPRARGRHPAGSSPGDCPSSGPPGRMRGIPPSDRDTCVAPATPLRTTISSSSKWGTDGTDWVARMTSRPFLPAVRVISAGRSVATGCSPSSGSSRTTVAGESGPGSRAARRTRRSVPSPASRARKVRSGPRCPHRSLIRSEGSGRRTKSSKTGPDVTDRGDDPAVAPGMLPLGPGGDGRRCSPRPSAGPRRLPPSTGPRPGRGRRRRRSGGSGSPPGWGARMRRSPGAFRTFQTRRCDGPGSGRRDPGPRRRAARGHGPPGRAAIRGAPPDRSRARHRAGAPPGSRSARPPRRIRT